MQGKEESMQIKMISLDKIKFDPNQPRQTIDHDKVTEMSQTIITEGVINPVEIDEDYVIITGELRTRAARQASLKEIPCKILKINPKTRFRRQVIENISHNTMSDWDTAHALERLRHGVQETLGEEVNHTGGNPNKGITELGRQIGKSKYYIIDHLAILESSKPLQKAIQSGKIPYTLMRILRYAPEQYKPQIEKKVLEGEFKNRDGGLMLVKALNDYPQHAKKLLAQDYSKYPMYQDVVGLIQNIIPSLSKQIKSSFNPPNELSEINQHLQEWMKQYDAKSLGKLHLPRIALTMAVMYESIALWMKQQEQINNLALPEKKGK